MHRADSFVWSVIPMAERRMFHTAVVESDAFLDMTPAAQALYFHIGMHADDDGFVNGPRQVCRVVGARVEDLQELIDGGFLLWFDGVAVVKHFRMANSLQNDRVKQLSYPEIAKKLYVLPNRIYTTEGGKRKENLYVLRTAKLKKAGIQLESKWNPNGFPEERKRKEKNRTEKKRTEQNIIEGKGTEAKGIPPAGGEFPATYEEENVGRFFSPEGVDIAPGNPDSCLKGRSDMEGDSSVAMRPQNDSGLALLKEERKGVVQLTSEQVYGLMTQMEYPILQKYVRKLADFIIEKDATIDDHFATILKWWREDGGKKYEV